MPDLQAQLRLLLISHNALILAFGAVNASQKAVWRNSANAQKALICFSVIRGLRAEIRASIARDGSGGEIVLVRFDRLRARWQSAGRRENFAEALSRDVRRDCSRRR